MATRQDRERLSRLNEKHKNILAILLAREENKFCADCLSKGPRWASWNLGVLLCIRCSGLHRSLGVHISRVKSVNLDTWTKEQMINFCSRGNGWAKEMYEAKLPAHFKRPQTDSTLEYFIRDKYEKKKYISPVEIPLRSLEGLGIEENESLKKPQKKSQRSKDGVSIVSIPKPRGLRAASPGIPRPSSMPQLPKHDNSPVQEPKVQNHTHGPTTDDLLGLSSPISNEAPVSVSLNAAPPASSDLTEDLFGPMSSFQTYTITSSISSPDLLNGTSDPVQSPPAPAKEKVEDKKLSKDSILSLYSQGRKTSPIATAGGNFAMTSQANMGYQQPQMQYNQQSFPNMQGVNMQGMQQNYQHQQMLAMQQQQQQQQQLQMQQMSQQMSGLNMSGMGYSGMGHQQQPTMTQNNMGYGMGFAAQPQANTQPVYNHMQQQAMYGGMMNGSTGMPQVGGYTGMQSGMMQNQQNPNGGMWAAGTVPPTGVAMNSGHTLSTQLWK